MKKQIVALAALAGLAIGAGAAHAAAATASAGGGIIGSKHDMNKYLSGHGVGIDGEQRVCAFCHTPHHANGIVGDQNVAVNYTDLAADPSGATTATINYTIYSPLWSRTLDKSAKFDPYVSVTFNPAAQGKPYDNLIGPSRLCMTCHDGNTALDSYYGKSGTSKTGDDTLDYFGSEHFRIGANGGLSNDHPIGMRYADYWSTDGTNGYELKNPATSKFNSPIPKSINDVLFTDSLGGEATGFVTCASCHDVHNGQEVGNTSPNNSGRGYFLRDTQKDSAFCVVCHAKDGGSMN